MNSVFHIAHLFLYVYKYADCSRASATTERESEKEERNSTIAEKTIQWYTFCEYLFSFV